MQGMTVTYSKKDSPQSILPIHFKFIFNLDLCTHNNNRTSFKLFGISQEILVDYK